MAASSHDSIFALKTEQRAVPVGATNSLFINGQVAGCNTLYLQHFSGGTLFITSDGSGSTLSGAALIAAASTGSLYVPPLTPLMIPGPASFYVTAAGATALVNLAYGKTQA